MTGNRGGAPLSATDHRLLQALLDHRVLTTTQVAGVIGMPIRTARYHLGSLRNHGLVHHKRPGQPAGSLPLHWWLTTAGHNVLGSPRRVRRPPGLTVLAHTAATAAVPLTLARLGPARGIHLERWARDPHAWKRWDTPSGPERITPDGCAVVRVDGHPVPLALLVEVDLDTMDADRVAEKTDRYLSYATRRVWRDEHETCPVVLILTTTPARVRSILAATAKVAKRRKLWTSDMAELLIAVSPHVDEPDVAVTSPVWQVSADAPVCTLTELLEARLSRSR